MVSSYLVKQTEIDLELAEEIYQIIVRKGFPKKGYPEISEEEGAEILHLYTLLFIKNGRYSRMQRLMKILESLVSKYPKNDSIRMKYVISLLNIPFKHWGLKGEKTDKYLEKIQSLIDQSKFSDEMLMEIRFLRNSELYESSNEIPENSVEYLEELVKICEEAKSLYFVYQTYMTLPHNRDFDSDKIKDFDERLSRISKFVIFIIIFTI